MSPPEMSLPAPRLPALSLARRAWLYFVLSFLVYHANLRPVASWDSVPTALAPFSLYLDSSLRLDRFGPWIREHVNPQPYFLYTRGGRDYSAYPLAQSVLLYPMYAPLLAALRVERWEIGEQVLLARVLEKFFASLLAAASVAVFYLLALRLAGDRAAPGLTLIYAFATTAWATLSQALWQHTGGVLLLLLAMWFLSRPDGRFALPAAGLCAALAVAIRPTNVLFAAAALLELQARRETPFRAALFLTPVAVAAAAVAWFNHAIFGDVRGVQAQGLDWRFFPGLAGELFSPARGLLIYCPFFAIVPIGIARGWKLGWVRLSLFYIAAHLALIAIWPLWWGGTCWGPRLLSEIMPFLVLLLAPALLAPYPLAPYPLAPYPLAPYPNVFRRKYLLAPLVAWAVFLQFTGAFFYPRGYWDDRPPESQGAGRYWEWRDNPIRRTLAAGMATEPYQVAWEGVRHGPAAAVRKIRELNMRGL